MFINDSWGLAELDQSRFLLFYTTFETLLHGQKHFFSISSLYVQYIEQDARGYLHSCPCPCLKDCPISLKASRTNYVKSDNIKA